MSITGLLSIFLAAILTNNYILSKFLGICPFLGVSKKLDTAVSMSAAVIVVMVVATDNRIYPDHCSTCSVH